MSTQQFSYTAVEARQPLQDSHRIENTNETWLLTLETPTDAAFDARTHQAASNLVTAARLAEATYAAACANDHRRDAAYAAYIEARIDGMHERSGAAKKVFNRIVDEDCFARLEGEKVNQARENAHTAYITARDTYDRCVSETHT